MGFFSKLRKKVRGQIAPVMPRRGGLLGGMPQTKPLITDMRFRGNMGSDFRMPQKPQKFTGLSGLFRRLQKQIQQQNQMPDAVANRPSAPILNKEGITSLPQENLNLEFLKRLPKNMMPNLDFSSLPKVSQDPLNIPEGFGVEQDRNTGQYYYLQQLTPEQKAENRIPERREISYDTPNMMDNMQFSPQFGGMVPGYAGGQLVKAGIAGLGRGKNIANKIFGRNIPDRAPNFGAVPIPGRGNLTYPATALNRIRNAENAIIGGGGLGVAGVIDATQGLTEPMAMANLSIDSPEQLGKDLAGMRIGLDRLIDIASQKAQEIGAATGEYVGRAQQAYEAEMEAERMQQLDAEQGLKNVSLLMAGGGEADSDDFPDLSGDGKTTFKDVLIGRGVDFKAAGGETVVTAPRLPARSKGSSDADRFFASYVSNPIEDESFRRSSIQDELLALLEESEGNLSNQDLMMIQNMLDQGNNQPYRMV
jgi:hypothetical protein